MQTCREVTLRAPAAASGTAAGWVPAAAYGAAAGGPLQQLTVLLMVGHCSSFL